MVKEFYRCQRNFERWILFRWPLWPVSVCFLWRLVGNCEKRDVPIDEHMKDFETCTFVQGVDMESIPVKPSALTAAYDICDRYM